MPTNNNEKIDPVKTRTKQYIITPPLNGGQSLTPFNSHTFTESNSNALNLNVIKRIKRSYDGLGLQNFNTAALTEDDSDILVIECDPGDAERVARSMPPNFIISENLSLGYGGNAIDSLFKLKLKMYSSTTNQETKTYSLRILGENDTPLAGAKVILVGMDDQAEGTSDEEGNVVLELKSSDHGLLSSLLVMKEDSYWDKYIPNPDINLEVSKTVRLQSFAETIPNFYDKYEFSWGQQLLGLEQAKQFTGRGVKIAIIDSGCDNEHPLLNHIQHGTDFVGTSTETWNQDEIGHGTHCAGIIAARSNNGYAFRGFAPEAEIHILRIFPRGGFNELLQAIQYCIANQIDIINMSLGADTKMNYNVEQELLRAVQSGIACFVASGNSGDEVKYPACSPTCFAVSAIGSLGSVRQDSSDITTIQKGYVLSNNIFVPNFSCHGPEVKVCAPGVGIISTVKGGKLGVKTGTSMATPHITGLAALLLAHHPLFQTQFQMRNVQRVDALYKSVLSLSASLPFGDHSGAGLPLLTSVIQTLQESVLAHGSVPVTAGGLFQPNLANLLTPESPLSPLTWIPYSYIMQPYVYPAVPIPPN